VESNEENTQPADWHEKEATNLKFDIPDEQEKQGAPFGWPTALAAVVPPTFFCLLPENAGLPIPS
jgi:hypothetical protein